MILDPQQHPALTGPRAPPHIGGVDDVSEMQEAGWRRREPRYDVAHYAKDVPLPAPRRGRVGHRGVRGQQAPTPKGAEWPTYGGDLASTRYSPLDQITKDNFNKLEVAWRFKTDALGPRPEFNFQAHAADGQRRRLLHRRLAPRRRRARRRHRRDAVDAQLERGQARRVGAAPALGTRPRVLDRRRAARAHRLRHARLPDGRARREDRRPASPASARTASSI